MQTRSRQKRQQQLQPLSLPSLPSSAMCICAPPLSSSSAGLLSLSEELQLLILSHLDARCLLVVGRVHRELRDAAAHPASWQHSQYALQSLDGFMQALPLLSHLHSLDVLPAVNLTDELLHRILLHLPQLAAIDLRYCELLSNRAFVSLSRLLSRELERVVFPANSRQRCHLDYVAVSLTALRHVSLQSVSLSVCPWLRGEDCLLHLSQLHRLERLELRLMEQLTDDSFTFLHCGKLWQRLSSLTLLRCPRLTDATLGSLSHLPGLASLDVTGCWRLSSRGLQLLASDASACRRSLQQLSMNECRAVTDDSVAVLLRFPALSSLSLNGCWKLTAASLPELAAHPGLHSLQCDEWTNNEWTAEDGRTIAAQEQEAVQRLMSSSSSLTSLSLGSWWLSAEAFGEACSSISSSSSGSTVRLQHLSLARADGPRSLCFLQQPSFSSLSSLVVDGNDLTDWAEDAMLAYIADGVDAGEPPLTLPALRSLSMQRCDGVAAMLPLLDAPLRSLDVSSCPDLRPSTLASIASSFPSLTALQARDAPVPRSALLKLSRLQHLELLHLPNSPLPLSSLRLFTRPAAFPCLASLSITVAAARDAVCRWQPRLRACHVGLLLSADAVGCPLRRAAESAADDDSDSASTDDDEQEEEEEGPDDEMRGDEAAAMVLDAAAAD